MKLRNKKTGEIVEATDFNIISDYNSLAELNEEWEDYEEPKEYWFIDYDGGIIPFSKMKDTATDKLMKQIGNYFDTQEEAEQAVEKLKAWKRLKDKGFKVDLWDYDGGNYQERIKTGRILFRVKDYEENDKDLDLLFGGEE